MANISQISILLSIEVAIWMTLCSGQGAKKNGIDGGQLARVEPGLTAFIDREIALCDVEIRFFDGTCTNDVFRVSGSASTAHFSYFPGLSSTVPTGTDLPSARSISNIVSNQPENVFNRRNLNELVTFFGQFFDHTIVGTTLEEEEPFNIPVNRNDPLFANISSGFLKFERSVRGIDITSEPRRPSGNIERPINIVSSATDLASVYGSNAERANALRTLTDGLLKTGEGDLLPRNTGGFFNEPSASSEFFFAGDHRSNETPVLTIIHVLFLREHNRLARDLKAIYPSWNDERLYQTARRINIAQFQKILYEEYFPVMTGRSVRRFRGFRPNAQPSVSLIFSTAALRIGHTMVGNEVTLRGPGQSFLPPISMEEMFFKPDVVRKNGIDPILRGAIFQKAQEVDILVHDSLRNFLFENVEGEEGFDLIALNLQRGRDHALPKYNDIRERFVGRRARSFSDISSDLNVQSRLSNAYGSVDNVEAWIGLVAEDQLQDSSMGMTMFNIWNDEFSRLRDGDRFFYLTEDLFPQQLINDFPRLNEIYTETETMRQIVLRNSGVTSPEIGSSVWLTS